ncbi:hypothetical protein ABKN59_004364 [Abortiporus biennis]
MLWAWLVEGTKQVSRISSPNWGHNASEHSSYASAPQSRAFNLPSQSAAATFRSLWVSNLIDNHLIYFLFLSSTEYSDARRHMVVQSHGYPPVDIRIELFPSNYFVLSLVSVLCLGCVDSHRLEPFRLSHAESYIHRMQL